MIRKKTNVSGPEREQDFQTTWTTVSGELRLVPMDKSGGFSVRPGIYEFRGAMALRGGVNFTVTDSFLVRKQLERLFFTADLYHKSGDEDPASCTSDHFRRCCGHERRTSRCRCGFDITHDGSYGRYLYDHAG